jgi:6-phosphogluconolactonase (cycloisomerase 2 family)
MVRRIAAAFLGASFSAAAVLAQAPLEISQNNVNARNADAYVYVSARVGDSNRTEVYGFAASSSGELRPVDGSPVAAGVTFLAVNGKYLFGSDTAGKYIHAFAIASDGVLRPTASTNVVRPGKACDNAGALFVDHAGTTVYNVGSYGTDCAEVAYQAFGVDKKTGRLELVHEAHSGRNAALLRFSADNRFAFGAGCAGTRPLIYGFVRHHDGSLTRISADSPLPTPNGNQGWCPYLTVADAHNHLVVPVYPSAESSEANGPFELATYSIAEDGTLTTTSTPENMPKIAVGSLTDLAIAPSGRLVAVAGNHGLQVFRVDGASPVRAMPGLLTRQEIDQMFWDGNGHLYAISQSAGKLWVFNVDEDGWASAPGSPYAVSGAQNIAVQPVEVQPKNDRPRDIERAASDPPYAAR